MEGDASTVDTTEVPTVAAAVVVDVDAGSGALGGGTGTVVMMVGVVPVVDVMVVTDEFGETQHWAGRMLLLLQLLSLLLWMMDNRIS